MRQAKKAVFLDALRQGATVKNAATAAGTSRATVYRERDADPAFAADWEDAYDEGADVLEEEAFRRAVHVGSDTLLIFLLKARRPARFRDNVKVEHVGKDDGPIQTEDRSASLADVAAVLRDTGAITAVNGG